MKIFVGADHNGFHMREALVNYLRQAGYDVEDEGDLQLNEQDDYPIFTQKVVSRLLGSKDPETRGILICGSGQGVCMAANRFTGIRACLGHDQEAVRACRNDEDSNVLCLPARVLKQQEANLIVETWLNTPFANAPRYRRRNQQLDELA